MSNFKEILIHDAEIETAADAFMPVLRFSVVSDVHIQRYNDIRSRRMAKMLKTNYAIAQADEHYKKLDGVIFAGDSADTGAGSQFMTFQSVLSANIKKETKPMVIIAKAHDCGAYKKGALTFFETLSGLTTDYHHVLKGFHFIGISTTRDQDTDVKYTKKQLAWLDTQLAKAAAVA